LLIIGTVLSIINKRNSAPTSRGRSSGWSFLEDEAVRERECAWIYTYILHDIHVHITRYTRTYYTIYTYILHDIHVHITRYTRTYYTIYTYILHDIHVHITRYTRTYYTIYTYILHDSKFTAKHLRAAEGKMSVTLGLFGPSLLQSISNSENP